MYVPKFQVLLLALVLFNLVILFYVTHIKNNWDFSENPKISVGTEKDVTVIIPEFEHFENDVAKTVESFLNIYPKIHVLAVSEDTPYPPVELVNGNAKVIVQNIAPYEPQETGRPESYIMTKYVLFMPDGVRLKRSSALQRLLQMLESEAKYIEVLTSTIERSERAARCETVRVDLRGWSMHHMQDPPQFKNGISICNFVSGDTAVLMRTSYLQNLTLPFAHPFYSALFIQAALRHWKVGLLEEDSLFEQETLLFTDQHNSSYIKKMSNPDGRRWKHQRNVEENIKKLYHRFGIKKVITRENVIEWYGCNKNTLRCFGTVIDDNPSFIHAGKWTPPCCLHAVRETAKHVIQVFGNQNLPYWLEGGSLLGAARSGDIIPWDYDVDIGMYKHDIEKIEFLRRAENGEKVTDADGYVWEKAREGEFFRVQYSHINHMHIDIFPFFEKNGIMTKNTWFKTHRQDTEFPAHYLKPLERISFIGIKALVPNNYRDFLEFKFGKGVIENPKYPNPKKIKSKPVTD